jgi:hypothetical protein
VQPQVQAQQVHEPVRAQQVAPLPEAQQLSLLEAQQQAPQPQASLPQVARPPAQPLEQEAQPQAAFARPSPLRLSLPSQL